MRKIPSIFEQMRPWMDRMAIGKIDVHPLGYVFSDSGYTNPQGVVFKSFSDDNGKTVSLKKCRSVSCPDRSKGGFPVVRGRASIPLKTCKLCDHHSKGCCSLLKWRGEA